LVDLSDLKMVPFKDRGRDRSGYDCYGLAMEVFRRYGIELLDYEGSCWDKKAIQATFEKWREQWIAVDGEPPVPAMVVMKANSPEDINHVAVYIGNGRFIHTLDKVGVCFGEVFDPRWAKVIRGIFVPRWVNYGKIKG